MITIKEVREKCSFEDLETNWRSKLLRKYSVYPTWALLQTNVTANKVTFLMFVFGLASIALFTIGNYFSSLVAILFFHFSILLDYCDGAVARYRNTFSFKGVYYDSMHHIIVNPLLILGISMGVYFNNPLPIPNYVFLIFGFTGMYGLMIGNFAKLKKYESYINYKKFEKVKELESTTPKFEKGIKVEIRDFFKIKIFNIIFVFGILNLLPYLVFIYGILTPLIAIRSFIVWKEK